MDSTPRWIRFVVVALLAVALAGMRGTPAHASGPTTITVTDCTDDGSGNTLRAAIQAANSDTGDTINFSCSGTIPLSSNPLGPTSEMTIDGGGTITIDGGSSVDLIGVYSASGPVTLTGLTLQNGFQPVAPGGALYVDNSTVNIEHSIVSHNRTGSVNNADYAGGAIFNSPTGTIHISDSAFSDNVVANSAGGAIFNEGTVTVSNSTFSGNGAQDGAAIDNGISTASLTVSNSTFSGNTANSAIAGTSSGGAIENDGVATVIGSTFSGNTSGGHIFGGYGGAIANRGQLSVVNSTVSGNSAVLRGGAIMNFFTGTASVTNSTLSGNTAPSGASIDNGVGGSLTIGGSIVAAASTSNCNGPFADSGNNLESGTSCGFTAFTDLYDADPKLGPLADYGGPTQTMAPLSGSPVIGASANCLFSDGNGNTLTSDQRGYQRLQSPSQCDIGAFDTGGVAAPGNLSVTPVANQASIQWNPVSGADSYQIVTVDRSQTPATTSGRQDLASTDCTGNPCSSTVTGLTTGHTYSFVVVGTDSSTHKGGAGSSSSVATLTSLQASADPSDIGQQVTYTATVSPVPDGGSVAFEDEGTTISGCGSRPVNTTTGIAACAVTYTSAGPHAITAFYSGHGIYDASDTTANPLSHTVNPPSTTTSLSSDHNPSTYGQNVTFTATVAAGSGTPSGTVDFTNGDADISGCTSVSLDGSGKATCQISTLAASTSAYSISAAFTDTDGSYSDSSTTVPLDQLVNKASSSTSISSGTNPSVVGGQVTFTAQVNPNPGGGSVAFKDGGTTIATCGAQPVNNGMATCSVSFTAAGTHTMSATYSGDGNYTTSSTTTSVSQQIGYTVHAVSTSSLTIVLQLWSAANTNVSASSLTVTAECVVSAPTNANTCGTGAVQSINQRFTFIAVSKKAPQAQYSYKLSSKGLKRGSTYYLLVQADGDPAWHAIQFTD